MAQPKIDLVRAQAMLDAGVSVRRIAVALDVSTEAIYRRVRRGELTRPEQAA